VPLQLPARVASLAACNLSRRQRLRNTPVTSAAVSGMNLVLLTFGLASPGAARYTRRKPDFRMAIRCERHGRIHEAGYGRNR